jgi:membrane protein YqaA with SNARE-associated domain
MLLLFPNMILGIFKKATFQWENLKNRISSHKLVMSWLKLFLVFIVLIIFSLGLVILLQYFRKELHFQLFRFSWLTYLIVLVSTFIFNLSIMVPVPFATAAMIAAAQYWNPVVLALFAAIGGTLGELSGYYAGYFGRKWALPKNMTCFQNVQGWIDKYGGWAISFLAFQPIIPFDIGGFFAGCSKMHILKFLGFLFIGKFPKYILICYAALGVLKFIPIDFI